MYNSKDTNNIRRGRKYLFQNQVYLVFLCKHKGNVLSSKILIRLQQIFEETCLQRKCKLLQFFGENDYVRLLVLLHPTVSVSSLTAKLKGKSSYFLMKEFFEDLNEKVVDKHFWASSYCAVSNFRETDVLEEIKEFLKKN